MGASDESIPPSDLINLSYVFFLFLIWVFYAHISLDAKLRLLWVCTEIIDFRVDFFIWHMTGVPFK
jgi:hypothetical protein